MSDGDRPVLADLPHPKSDGAPPTAATIGSGPTISPKARISLYEPREWEEFVVEWVHVLRPAYALVKGLAGSGDRGIDIAAFRSDAGLSGPWDCFQCKHYDHPLRVSEINPEVFKVLLAVCDGIYRMPERYWIVAPRECGTALNLLLGNAAKFKAQFCAALADRDKGLGKLGAEEDYERVGELAASTDFRIFESKPLLDVIVQHRSSPHHAARFGGGLGPRPAISPPPPSPEQREQRYLEQLVAVYSESYPSQSFDHHVACNHSNTAAHYTRQRESFYSAEALRVFARDETPPGTFDLLQGEVFDGVVETHDRRYDSGMDCLTSVLEAAVATDLTTNGLISAVTPRDRKGICHQLANEDRVTWVRP